ncbi:transposase [Kitasatospora sp. NPDC004669]|uniref:RNA-guided endonuclease InsQ/TnpB family protein n=1 Tax=Kitasatospora sp. NPDC004669 TaxID=3154555 RepID=UPI00339F93AA
MARLHHEVAVRRANGIHQLTKQLATGFAVVAVEDLNVAGMAASARGTVERPGREVRQKAGLNRSVLDAAPAEVRHQLTYRTSWYGSKLAVLDRWFPSSKTCSACGEKDPRRTLADREYHCGHCGLRLGRDLNAARNIAAHARLAPPTAPGGGVASSKEDARGAHMSPVVPRDCRQSATKREDSRPPGLLPPPRSDRLALPPPAYTGADEHARRQRERHRAALAVARAARAGRSRCARPGGRRICPAQTEDDKGALRQPGTGRTGERETTPTRPDPLGAVRPIIRRAARW